MDDAEARTLISKASDVESSATFVLNADALLLGQVSQAAEKFRRAEIDRQFSAAEITDLRAYPGSGLRLGPLLSAGYRTCGQLDRDRARIHRVPGVGPATVGHLVQALAVLRRRIEAGIALRPDPYRMTAEGYQLVVALGRRLWLHQRHEVVSVAGRLKADLDEHLPNAKAATRLWRRILKAGQDERHAAVASLAELMRRPDFIAAANDVVGLHRLLVSAPNYQDLVAAYAANTTIFLGSLERQYPTQAGHPPPRRERTAPGPAVAGRPIGSPASPAPQPSPGGVAKRKPRWVEAQDKAELSAGVTVFGPLYFGDPAGVESEVVEPSQVQPALAIDALHPDWSPVTGSPSYAQLSPAARAAYVAWLADRRRYAGAPEAFPLLYLYGLERRMATDLPTEPRATAAIEDLQVAVQELREKYRRHETFEFAAVNLKQLLERLRRGLERPDGQRPPRRPSAIGLIPESLRLALAAFAADRRPIPADWALAWAWHHPDLNSRLGGLACPDEFDHLFVLRYDSIFKGGIRPRPDGPAATIAYDASNPTVGSRLIAIPKAVDVFDQPRPVRALSAYSESLMDDLRPYSNWLDRNPAGRRSLGAAALLPDDLQNEDSEDLAVLRAWAKRVIEGPTAGIVPTHQLISMWAGDSSSSLDRSDRVALARAFGRVGFGVEPDVRFGGAENTHSVALFEDDPASAAQASSPEFAAAAGAMVLAMAVSEADGHVSPAEVDYLRDRIDHWPGLTESEHRRLGAQLDLCLDTGTPPAGLADIISRHRPADRGAIGELLVEVALADDELHSDELELIQRLHEMLGLDGAFTSFAIAKRPRKRTGSAHVEQEQPEMQISPTADRGAPAALTPPSKPRAGGRLLLDPELLAQKAKETAQVRDLLLAELGETTPDPPPSRPDVAEARRAEGGSVPGLDHAHSLLLRDLVVSSTWSRDDFDQLARKYGLMPDGAIDRINEAAMDLADDLLVTDNGTVEVDMLVAEAMKQ